MIPVGGATERRKGTFYGLACYILWGFFPLYFHLVRRTNAFEIIADRLVFAFLFCLLLISLLHGWRAIGAIWSQRGLAASLALSGVLITANWTIYVWGVTTGHAIDAALGYFINPLLSTLIGVVGLHERLRRPQVVAFGFGALAVVALIVGYGKVPWVALGVSTSFAFYTLVKNRQGSHVRPLPGLLSETAAVVPAAVVFMVWSARRGTLTTDLTTPYGWLLALAGPMTAVPLLLFAAAAARVTMTTIGVLQYISPLMQFLVGWLILGEQMPAARWVGFVIIWIAVLIFLCDTVRVARQGRHMPVTPEGATRAVRAVRGRSGRGFSSPAGSGDGNGRRPGRRRSRRCPRP